MQSPLRRITNTTEEGKSLSPSLSGDGRIVAFESTEDIAHAGGSESFRAIRANVSVDPATFLQMAAARAPAPAISQDGSRIAFAAKDDPLGTNNDFNSEIFLYDGARLIQVTNTSPGDIAARATNGNFQPSISDDGRFIAFSSNRNPANQNSDGNLEIFAYDTVALSFTQLTNSSGIVGFTAPKIGSNNESVAYIRDTGATPSANRDLLLQNLAGAGIRVLAANAAALALTYGRAISDDGQRVVWSAQTATNTTQVFLFDGRNNVTRQITTLGSRTTDVPLHPTISGDGSRIAFATRRSVAGMGSNSDTSVELYTFDIPSGTFGRVTNVNSSGATADVVSSMNDDGSVIAFNFPRVLSGPVSKEIFENDSEIYITGTPPRPVAGTLTILNRASFGHEPSSIKAVAPDSIAVALGSALAFTTEQSQRQADGTFPTTVGGTTVTVNGQSAQIFFVSPTEVHFHVPAPTLLGTAEVVVTNSDGFQSRGNVTTLMAAPGVFTTSGDGLGEGMILNADTLQAGPFDPSNGNLRLTIFSTGVRNGTAVSVAAGSRALTLESIVQTPNMPGMDEIHVLVPADLRGVGKVDLVVRADGRDSNPVTVQFIGDARRDVLINEFLADPPESLPDPTVGDANRDGVRSASQDEFIELVNTTTHDIDISGYQILTRGTGSDTLRHVFAAGTILRSCSAVVVFGGGNPSFNPNDPAFGGAQVVKASSGGLSLVNSGGAITLQDQASTVVNLVAYGGSSGIDADNNQSVTRSPDITGSFAQHLAASGGARLFSPGTQINGAAFNSCTPAIARVEVSPSAATIDTGAQQQFTARAFDAGNNEVPGVIFSWQSSNTAVATIDQNGLATGLSAGMTEIRATGRGVQSAPAMLTVNPLAPPNVVINEVDSDQAGTDTAEFVELYDGGTGNTSLTGLVVVFYNGSDDQSYAAFDLDALTTNANGYFTLGNAAVPGVDRVVPDGTMQNGADAVAIYVGNASDFPNGTSVTTTNLIDALVYDTNDADDPGLLLLLNSGQPQINEDTGSNGEVNSNQRCPNGSGGARTTSTYNQFSPTPDGANVCVVTTPPPTLTINDVSLDEGNTSTTTFTFTVSLSAPAPTGGVTFDIATADNTATVADNDYQAKSLTAQTIAAGNQTYQFTVAVNGDASVEPNETFFVNVTNVSGATIGDGQGLGPIQNDDSPTLSIADVSASEGNSGTTTFTFTVTSSLPAPAGGITFDIATADTTAQDDNPATEDNDYVAKSLTTQTISAGNTAYSFDVTVNGDTLVEPNETFFVNVTNVSGATIADGQGVGTIQNDDGAVLVISQVYAGGGNSGAQFTNDFVEIFNRVTTTVNFATTPYSVQYAGATSNFGSSKVDLTSGSIAPGQYFLVQLSGGANGAPLPTPDATGSIAMAATAGKVALVAGTTALTGTGCPLAATVADFVGYGTTADCFEGSGRAPAPSNTTADFRKAGGCTDTNDNAADFLVAAPGPRNSASPVNDCSAADLGITKTDAPDPVIAGADVTYTITVTNNGPATAQSVVVTDNLPANVTFVSCASTGSGVCGGSGNSRSVTFSSLASGESATITLVATANSAGGTTIENTATVGSATTDSNSSNNSATATTSVQAVLPVLSINDLPTIAEGNGGTTTATFTVTLSPSSSQIVMVNYATSSNSPATATAGTDYQSTSGTLTFNPGETSKPIVVTINGDTLVEPDETFFVQLSIPINANISDGEGQGTIQNDDIPLLVISQVYGGGGLSGATYTNDFIEIYNRGTTTVDFSVTAFSVQYAGAQAAFGTFKTDITSGSIAPGKYFLVQESSGGGLGAALPAPDATGTINLNATAGKVALVSSALLLAGNCPGDDAPPPTNPSGATIVDFVGYGFGTSASNPDCFEGTGRVTTASGTQNNRSIIRDDDGCEDTDDNATNFTYPPATTPPVARNQATAVNLCP